MSETSVRMDRLYRHQRHLYDLTRKYYLPGRDRLIAGLAPPPGGRVLEVGCGTARNLIRAARLWPQARLHGLDVSHEMLRTARGRVERAGAAARHRRVGVGVARAELAADHVVGVEGGAPGEGERGGEEGDPGHGGNRCDTVTKAG